MIKNIIHLIKPIKEKHLIAPTGGLLFIGLIAKIHSPALLSEEKDAKSRRRSWKVSVNSLAKK